MIEPIATAVIASEAKQSIHPSCRAMDCFASLAMTSDGVAAQRKLRALQLPNYR
jgi:hypothetical protein